MTKSTQPVKKRVNARKTPNSTEKVEVRISTGEKTPAPVFSGIKAKTPPGGYTPYKNAWKVRSSVWLKHNIRGPKFRYADPKELWAACCEYFEWVQNTPVLVPVVIKEGREAAREVTQPKLRPMSVAGLCIFLGIHRETWLNYKRKRGEMFEVITLAEQIMYAQKFDGACVDIFNGKIIARDLASIEKENEEMNPDRGFLGVYKMFRKAGVSKKVHET